MSQLTLSTASRARNTRQNLSDVLKVLKLIPRNRFSQEQLVDTTPLPDSIPKVKELGASSAPLLSASFFIGARCKDYNDDFMKCKTDNPGKGEFECLKEGRRVTRCARSV